MEYTKTLMNCVCGKKPQLSKDGLNGSKIALFYRYRCEKCDVSTFGTNNELCSRELWNATITRKINE